MLESSFSGATNYDNFISSDFLLDKLGVDPEWTQTRLGDGFYEQRLVLDQITQLTGRRYLGNYADGVAQYRALLESGVAAAGQLQLSMGVGLTAAQAAALTQDIVWMVEQEYQGQTVLVPVVYLASNSLQLRGNGALIAGGNVELNATNSMSNQDVIAGADVSITAGNLLNQGRISGTGSVALEARNDLLNQGQIQGRDVALVAGNNLVSEASKAINGVGILSGISASKSPLKNYSQAPNAMFASHGGLEDVEERARTTCNQRTQKCDPAQQPPQVVAGGAAEHVQCIALGAVEMAAIQAAVLFQMSDHRLYRLPSFDPAPLPSRQRSGFAPMQDLHTLHLAPAIPQVHDGHLRDHIHILEQPARLFQLLGQRVAVVGIAGKTARAHDQALARTHRNADLDAEFVRVPRLALADAFHFRRVQRVEFLVVLGTLCQQPVCALQPDTDALTHRRFPLGQLALQIA